jgi:cell division transport system permease protein
MSLRTLEFATVESMVGIRRNALMALASIVTLAMSLAVLGGFVLAALGLSNATQTQLKNFELAVFVKNGASKQDVAVLETSIRKLPNLASVEFVSKEEAWPKFKQERKGQIDLTGVQSNPLPDSFRIKVSDAKLSHSVAERIRQLDNVDEVEEAAQQIAVVLKFANMVKLIGGIAIGILFIVTAFIVGNTIRLTVYARRHEIRIMRLVGATNWFIRLPFVFEGMLLGIIGGGVACGLVYGGTWYASQTVTKIMPLFAQFSSDLKPLHFYGGMVALGCVLGMLSSWISVRRFLKM